MLVGKATQKAFVTDCFFTIAKAVHRIQKFRVLLSYLVCRSGLPCKAGGREDRFCLAAFQFLNIGGASYVSGYFILRYIFSCYIAGFVSPKGKETNPQNSHQDNYNRQQPDFRKCLEETG